MTPNKKKQLYDEYLNQVPRDIKIEIPNGPKITWTKCWDYKSTVKEYSFKTLTAPKVEHKLMKTEAMSLMPVANVKYWQVTVLRQEPPEIKPDKPKGRGHAHNSY